MTNARFLANRRLAPRLLPLALAVGLAACGSGEQGAAPAAAVATPAPPPEPLRYDTEYPTMRYATAARTDPVAKLAERLARGEAKLERGPRGYLDSLLAALAIDPASQTLVFSQTSLQSKRIRPEKPRAIYFNDEVYVAWVQEGPLEIGSMDPNLGPVFYLLEQDAPKAAFDHQLTRCLSCHDSYSLSGGGVPRFIVGSGYIGPSGNLVSHEGWILVTDETPLKSRWGGWYVTGHHGKQVHLGNVLIRSLDDFQRLEDLRVGNIDNLDALFDTKPYITDKSDIVALLVLEHQVNAQNGIARLSWDARTAIDKEPGRAAGAGYDLPAAELSPATRDAMSASVEALVQTMLFAGETKLTDRISGDPKFTAQFLSRAVRDGQGRSLRDFDLETRVFRYPLSYLVYSAAFDALPQGAREMVYERFAAVLRGEDRSEPFARLSDGDRAAILAILAATKPEFAASLH
jgi:hypothetical protein